MEKAWQTKPSHEKKFHQAWLVTNTKLTTDAIQYARCVGIRAIGWSYPPGESLPELIERAGLHPITTLTSLSRSQKRQLMDKGIILCREIEPGALKSIGLMDNKAKRVTDEARELCRPVSEAI